MAKKITEGCFNDEDNGTGISNDHLMLKASDGVIVRILNGAEILFVDLDGDSSIGELRACPRLRNCDLYKDKYIVEGNKAAIRKIAKIEQNYFVVEAKYINKNGQIYNNFASPALNNVAWCSYNPFKSCRIGLRGCHGKYLCCEPSGKCVINRGHLREWETFISVPVSQNVIGLKSYFGKYLSAQPDGRLEGNRDKLLQWEQFTIINNKNDGTFGLLSYHGKYLSAQSNGNIEINRDKLLGWETFKIKVIDYNVDEKKVCDPLISVESDNYDPTKECKIGLLGHFNKYLCCEPSTKCLINRGHLKIWETFTSIPISGNKIGLKSYHGKYLSCQSDGRLEGNRDKLLEWEQFEVIKKGNKYAFKSCHGKFLSAQPNGNIEVNRDKLLQWEEFRVKFVQ